jgi:WD40 repeat protein
MPRVVCQVRARPGRVSFIWSAGEAAFAPYHLDGPDAAGFLALAEQARHLLRALATGGDSGGAAEEVVRVGQELYRKLFDADNEGSGIAVAVRAWLASLEEQGSLENVEFLGDYEIAPWNVLCDRAAESGWQNCWGGRLPVAVGRRAGPLRPVETLEQPVVLLVVDPGTRAALPEEQKRRLDEFAEVNGLEIIASLADLRRAVRDKVPDFLYLFCRAASSGLLLAEDVLTPADLEEMLRGQGGSDMPWTSRLVFINACHGEGEWTPVAAGFQSLGLGGLILPDEPADAGFASAFGLEFLAGFLYQGQPAGSLLQRLRQRTAPRGLLYEAACPPWLRVSWQEGETEAAAPQKGEKTELPAEPYRPLVPYDREDRALFVGRENDTALAAGLLDAPGVRLLLVHGRAAVGKSSLLRAGVLPYLEVDGIGYRTLRDRQEEELTDEDALPVIAVRATNDLPGQLALALASACARPCSFSTPTGRTVTVDLPGILRQTLGEFEKEAPPEVETPPISETAVRAALLADPALLGRLLTALADSLPYEPILLIEQGEEVFSLARIRQDAENRQVALEMLRRLAAAAGAGKVVVLLRTEYYGRLVSQLRQGLSEPARIRDYFLTELNEAGMIEAVVQPTLEEPIPYSGEVPLEKYGFRYEAGLPELLVRRVRETARVREESALALLQVVCARLADASAGREDRLIHEADVNSAGGIPAGLAGYLDELLKVVASSNSRRRRLRGLLGRLYRSQPDGTITRDLVPMDKLTQDWRGPPPLDTVIEAGSAEEVRLFETYLLGTGDQEKLYVSLGSDALAPVVARWDREDRLRREHGRKVTIDWLWVVIPLVLLLLVLGWTWMRTRRAAATAEKQLEESQLEVKAWKGLLDAVEKGTEFPLYVSHLNEAEEAWAHGEAVRFRQLLLNHRRDPRPVDDLRGFEWYHLWQLRDRSRATLVGHEGPVASVALSADGKLAASGASDGQVRLWTLLPPGQRGRINMDGGPVNAVAFSRSGLLLACGLSDGTVRVLDLANSEAKKGKGVRAAAFGGHAGPVLGVALSPDGKMAASCSSDGTVRLWDIVAGKSKNVLKDHSGPVLAVTFSPDGKLLASAGQDGTILVWDGSSGEKKHVLSGPTGPVRALAFSPDGKRLASGAARKVGLREQGEVKFWDAAAGKAEKGGFDLPTPVLALAYVEDGKGLLTGCQDDTIRLWDAASGQQRETFHGHLGSVRSLAVSGDSKIILSAASDSTVKLWSLDSPGARQTLAAHKGPAVAIALSPNGKLVLSGGQDGLVKLWDAATGREVRTLKGEQGPVTSLAVASQDGKLLAASGHAAQGKEGGVILLWDADKGTILHTLKGHEGSVNAVALAGDGSLLVSGGADKTVRTWDTDKGTQRQLFKGHTAAVLSVALAPGKSNAASGDAAGIILLEDLNAAKPEKLVGLRLFPQRHKGPVQALSFVADNLVLSGGTDGTIGLWGWQPGKGGGLITTLGRKQEPVLALALSPFWDTIAAGGPETGIRLWDVERRELRHTLPGSAAPIRGLAFNNRLLAAACEDGSVRLWRSAPLEPPAPREVQGEQE